MNEQQSNPQIVWDEPPPGARGRPAWTLPVIAQLKAHPGRWAKVKSGSAYAPSGHSTMLKRHGCEAVIRKLADGFALYARWPE